jgi:hypothetical protein
LLLLSSAAVQDYEGARVSNDIPNIREYCFGDQAIFGPDMMLAIWAKTYLTDAQFKEFRRLIKETRQDGVEEATVEQMIGLVEMAQFMGS